MVDDKTKKGADRRFVSLTEDYEVRYWTQRFGVTKEQLAEAVQAVGNAVNAVEEYLRSRQPAVGERRSPAAE